MYSLMHIFVLSYLYSYVPYMFICLNKLEIINQWLVIHWFYPYLFFYLFHWWFGICTDFYKTMALHKNYGALKQKPIKCLRCYQNITSPDWFFILIDFLKSLQKILLNFLFHRLFYGFPLSSGNEYLSWLASLLGANKVFTLQFVHKPCGTVIPNSKLSL